MDDKAHQFHACNAIAKAINRLPADRYNCGPLGSEWERRQEEFRSWFEPKDGATYYWPMKDRASRVLALCFMAVIADSVR